MSARNMPGDLWVLRYNGKVAHLAVRGSLMWDDGYCGRATGRTVTASTKVERCKLCLRCPVKAGAQQGTK